MRMLLVGVAGAIGRLVQRKIQQRRHGGDGNARKLPSHAPTSPGYPDIPNLPNDPAGKA